MTAPVQRRTTATVPEALGIATLCFGWFILSAVLSFSAMTEARPAGSGGAASSDGFTDAGFAWLMAVEVVLGATALYVLRARQYAIETLYPEPNLRGIGAGAFLYIAAAFVAAVVVSPFATQGLREPIEQLTRGHTYSLPIVVALGLVNGAYEEIFLLGFLQRGLRQHGLAIATGVSLLVRMLYHLYQGPMGALYVGVLGLVFALYYAANLRLFPVVFAHALADIVPLALG